MKGVCGGEATIERKAQRKSMTIHIKYQAFWPTLSLFSSLSRLSLLVYSRNARKLNIVYGLKDENIENTRDTERERE